MNIRPYYFVAILLFATNIIFAQKQKQEATSKIEIDTFHHLKFRNIGPFRGGRSVASTGVVGQPMTYYMGSTGGGIWKTTDDGITWINISDGYLNTGTVGAIAVAESNPNIIVAGMGEHAARGVMTSMGDGVYKSMDAGKTWKHIGLDSTRHISDVIIHPNNPDIIFISAQGAQYGPSEDRGIYRSTDGGSNWEKVLYVDENTGASALSMDFNNPLILYASMWEHRRYPWRISSGGKQSGLYVSTDGGTTWDKMTKGLPEEFGKSGISVSRANSERVFAVIEAEGDKGGVYRSDNAGKSWTQVSKDRVNVARAWYYMEIYADPQNEDVVYVLNAPVMKSIDGGRTYTNIPVPHGDNHHLWIHPYNNKVMINSNDGGANISNNGGKSWSAQENQPTAQFYRVITDNLVPYNVYGGQQDNSAISIKSRTNGRGIDWKDWHSVAGCESAYLAFDPDNPDLIYGGCYQGIIDKFRNDIMVSKEIKAYPELALGNVPADFKYRFNWNAPIIASPHDRKTIYHAGNVVFRTNDEGHSWKVVSPDLTRNNKEQQIAGGGPYTNEAAGGENYNTIMYLVESKHEKGTLWAGSDDGLIHITRNGGESWENVTPKGMKEGIVNAIEVSPHDPATAYAVLMRYKMMDLTPYVYKTDNYGKSWKLMDMGIDDPHTFVRVVREDPVRKGMLYAGTETGLYISFDGGQNWQKMQLNLPVVPINDLILHDNDMIIATAGRSFWILDDLSALQNVGKHKNELAVFQPKDHYLLFGGSTSSFTPGLGQNPDQGVHIDYFLPEIPDSIVLQMEILSNGKVINKFSSEKDKNFKSWTGGPSAPKVIPREKGYNRFTWNFQKEGLPGVENVFVYGSYNGSYVSPGTYTIRIFTDTDTVETTAKILPNPAMTASPEDYAAQQDLLDKIENTIRDIHSAVTQIRSAKTQIKAHDQLLSDNENAKALLKEGKEILKKVEAWENKLIQPDQKTFQDVINFHNKLNAELMNLKSYVESAEPRPTVGAMERWKDLEKEWSVFADEKEGILKAMEGYNDLYKSLDLPILIIK